MYSTQYVQYRTYMIRSYCNFALPVSLPLPLYLCLCGGGGNIEYSSARPCVLQFSTESRIVPYRDGSSLEDLGLKCYLNSMSKMTLYVRLKETTFNSR